jgi:plastocyanin
MSNSNFFKTLRVDPKETAYLDRQTASNGDIAYDKQTKTLRIFDGITKGGVALARSDFANVTNAAFLAKANAAGFSGGVQAGVAGRLAYYPAAGSQVNDLTNLAWDANTSTLNLTGIIEVSGQKNRIRFHWDTLADLVSEVSAVDYHGMIAHAHDTGKLYYAHASAWVPVASESIVPNSVTLVEGSGISIISSNDSTADVYTISSVANTGSVTFAGTVIDSDDSSAITFIPTVAFDSDVVVGNEIVFADGSRQSTSSTGTQGPPGPPGPAGASGAGTGDVLSAGGGYVDNAIIRYDGTTGTIIQNSSATISDVGLLTATSFSGSGANITALNATNLDSGTVPVLRLGTAGTRNVTTFLRGDNTWAAPAADSFATIAVAGQSNVVADSATDTLTLVAGTNITITTDAGTDTITINSTGGGVSSDSFSTIAVAGQTSVVADSATDTLTLVAGTGISITTVAGTDTITITSTASGGASAFDDLTDAVSASLTIDRIYLPAITMLDVTANGTSAYRFDQYGTADDPTIYAINGTTIAFNLAGASGHPFLIQDGTGVNYDTGLVHVSTTGAVSTGSAAQAKTSGTLYWKIPSSISGGYRYQCQSHLGMVGTITVKNFVAL